MPGLFGVIDASRMQADASQEDLVSLVRQMATAMQYAPEYSTHLTSIPSLGACVGQVEMTGVQVIDQAPFVAVTGERRDAALPLDGSAQEIARALSGTCAGFVADREARTCILFNDLFGRERVFLHTDGQRTIFASEAKAILAVVPITRTFDARGLAEFVACGCTLATHSLYRHVEVLPPGTIVTVSPTGTSRHRPVSEAAFEGLSQLPDQQFLPTLISNLRAEVSRCVRSAPSSAISLTGGLDSRMVVASIESSGSAPQCYTFGSMYRTTGDVSVARAVAARCGFSHQVIAVGPEFLRDFGPHLEQAVYISDGYLGLPGAAELYANRHARQIAPARMTGNWGGEMMRGVRAFKFVIPRGGFLTPDLLRGIAESESAFTPPTTDPLSSTLFHQVPYQGYGRYAIERSQVAMRTPFLGHDVVDTLYRARGPVRRSLQTASAVIGQRPALLQIPTDAGLLGGRAAALRRHWRRAVIKAEYMTSHGAPDWLARVGSWLPAPLLETRFLGVDKFYHYRRWMRRELAPFVTDTVQAEIDGPLGEWFDMRRVADMCADHTAGRGNHTDALDKVITLAVARRTLLAKPRAEAISVSEAAPCRVL